MHVTVAITPPEHVLDDVAAVLARIPPPPGEFELTGRGALMLPVFALGNVTRPEATAVADFLSTELDRRLPPAQVRLAGVWALEAEGDPTVGIPLVGEVDRLDALARTLWDLVTVRGYFVDRRRWTPRMTIGSVTATTSLEYLEQLVAALEGYSSPPWPVASIGFLRRSFGGDGDDWDVVEEVPTSLERH